MSSDSFGAPSDLVIWCIGDMARLTITLSDERHRALKERAARTGMTIGEVIEESLEEYGVHAGPTGRELIEQARAHSSLSDDEAMNLAVEETRAERRERSKRES